MNIRLHISGRTAAAVRAEWQTAIGSNKALARRYDLTPATLAKWRGHEAVVGRGAQENPVALA